ncbi:MAG: porin [Pseudomonadota bacterium]
MKKSLIALAVAGAFAAPAMASTSNVDIYGQVRASVDYIDSDAANTDRWTFNDQTSRIGIKGSEDLGGGLKAIFQWESQLNTVDSSTVGTTQRNTFVGLAGGFGTLILGNHDTPYKLGGSADVFGDTSADAQKNTTGIISRGGWDNRAAGTIAYVSPTFSGFHVAAAIVPGEQTGASAANGLMDAYSLVAVYENGPLKATLGYENWDQALITGATEDKDAAKFNVSYKIGDLGLGATYERADVRGASTTTDKAYLLSATYGMGPITLAAQYGNYNTTGSNSDVKRTTLGVIYGLSKRTNAYAAYNMDNNGGTTADVNVLTMGMNHSF